MYRSALTWRCSTSACRVWTVWALPSSSSGAGAGAGTAVVLLTTFREDTCIQRAFKTGDPRKLLAALNADRLGQAADARERVQPLSGREREVLALLRAGLPRMGVRNRVQAAVL